MYIVFDSLINFKTTMTLKKIVLNILRIHMELEGFFESPCESRIESLGSISLDISLTFPLVF